MVVVIGGFSDKTTFRAIWGLLERSRQYTYALSRTSGLSFSAVAAWKIFCTRDCAWG